MISVRDICPPGTKRVQLHGPDGPVDAWATVRGLTVGEREGYEVALRERAESGDNAAMGAYLPNVLVAVVKVDGVALETGEPVPVEWFRDALLGPMIRYLENVLDAIHELTYVGVREGN